MVSFVISICNSIKNFLIVSCIVSVLFIGPSCQQYSVKYGLRPYASQKLTCDLSFGNIRL